MGQILYYAEPPALLDKVIPSHIRNGYPTHRTSAAISGPGGTRGFIQCWPATDPGALRYAPDHQRWTRCDEGKYWIGIDVADLPRPQDLLRKSVFDGYAIELGDGQEWVIPPARISSGAIVMPTRMALDSDGTVVSKPLTAFERLEVIAARFYEGFRCQFDKNGEAAADAPEFTDGDWFDMAVEALRLNYRVGHWEVSALELVTTVNRPWIAYRVCDMPFADELAKQVEESPHSKKNKPIACENSNIDDGSQGAQTQTIDPQSPS